MKVLTRAIVSSDARLGKDLFSSSPAWLLARSTSPGLLDGGLQFLTGGWQEALVPCCVGLSNRAA